MPLRKITRPQVGEADTAPPSAGAPSRGLAVEKRAEEGSRLHRLAPWWRCSSRAPPQCAAVAAPWRTASAVRHGCAQHTMCAAIGSTMYMCDWTMTMRHVVPGQGTVAPAPVQSPILCALVGAYVRFSIHIRAEGPS